MEEITGFFLVSLRPFAGANQAVAGSPGSLPGMGVGSGRGLLACFFPGQKIVRCRTMPTSITPPKIPQITTGFAGSWAQFFLKYLLGDSRVTAVIPGTGDPKHMLDNLGAMRGRLPDAAERAKMVSFVEAL
jgi:hypothetical protein